MKFRDGKTQRPTIEEAEIECLRRPSHNAIQAKEPPAGQLRECSSSLCYTPIDRMPSSNDRKGSPSGDEHLQGKMGSRLDKWYCHKTTLLAVPQAIRSIPSCLLLYMSCYTAAPSFAATHTTARTAILDSTWYHGSIGRWSQCFIDRSTTCAAGMPPAFQDRSILLTLNQTFLSDVFGRSA